MNSQRLGRAALALAGAVPICIGLGVVALAIADLVQLDSAHTSAGIGIAVMLFVLGAGLAVAGVFVVLARPGARGPVVVGLVIAVLVSWSARSDAGALAWLVLAGSLVALAALYSPWARAVLAQSARPDSE